MKYGQLQRMLVFEVPVSVSSLQNVPVSSFNKLQVGERRGRGSHLRVMG